VNNLQRVRHGKQRMVSLDDRKMVMKIATFRFYAELNDFLKPGRRHQDFDHGFRGNPSVKDTVEALGIPHTEVDLILVNGESVDFNHSLEDGDRVSVYPIFEGLDIGPAVRLRPAPLREPRFVLDIHLGRLAAYLRMLGFDALYRNDFEDAKLAEISRDEKRVLLTKDRGLLKRSVITHGYCVRGIEPRRQVREVLQRFDLFGSIKPFSRCMHCNGNVLPVSKQEVLDQLLPETRSVYDEFSRCDQCARVYWKGSHYERMMTFIQTLYKDRETTSSPSPG
jgi:uncharacterized protein with PIN domain